MITSQIAAAPRLGRRSRQASGGMVRMIGALLAAVMVAGAAVGLVSYARKEGERPLADRRSDVLAYDAAVDRPARDGGFVIQEGLMHGLAQVATDQGGSVSFQAVSWVATLQRVREQFAAAADGLRNDELQAAAAGFDTALVLYENTAETIGAAAIASGESRTSLLERASISGREADARYDAASASFQKARRSVGLGASHRFPDPAERP